jgi:hypothetical protein
MYDTQTGYSTLPFGNHDIRVIELDPFDKVEVTKRLWLSVEGGRHSLVDLKWTGELRRGTCIWLYSKMGVTNIGTDTKYTASKQ